MIRRLLLLAICLGLSAPSEAALAYYKSVTVDHTQVGGSTHTDFPVTIFVTDADLKTTGNGGYVQNANGYDIRPFSDSALTSALTYELVAYTATTGALEMHVKIASLSSAVDNVFYLGFGDASLSSNGSSTSTWNSGFKAVFHSKDGATLSLTDSTSNANTLTNNGSVAAATGQIDGAAGPFSGGGDKMLWKTAPVTTVTDDFLFTIWFKLSATTDDQTLFSNGDVNSGVAFLTQSSKFQGLNNAVAFIDSGVSTDTSAHYFAMRRTGGSTQLYLDGTAAGSASGASVNVPAAAFSMGTTVTNPAGPSVTRVSTATWSDEARFSSSARTAAWITAEYNNQKAASTFLTFGARTATGGGGATPNRLMLLGVK